MANQNINSFILNLPRSSIRRIMDKAIQLDPDQKEIIHLEIGQPEEPTSKIICEAASRAALGGFTKYTQNAGFIELRKALKEKLQNFNNIYINEDNIFITPGATSAVALAIGVLINHGSEVLIPDPGYPNFSSVTLHYGGIVRYYTLEEANGFKINFNKLKSLINDKTKLLIINSPSNPTGTLLSKDEIKKLIKFTYENNLFLLSDEVYESFVYSGKHISPLSFPNTDNVISIFSFSKSFNMTGLRIGYIVSRNETICKGLLKAIELYISCAPSISQIAAIDALKFCDKEVVALKKRFQKKRGMVLKLMRDDVKYIPQGAFYVLINISRTGLSSNEFADALLETEKVAVAPGASFGPSSDKYIRVALTADTELLKDGINRIKKFLQNYNRYERKT